MFAGGFAEKKKMIRSDWCKRPRDRPLCGNLGPDPRGEILNQRMTGGSASNESGPEIIPWQLMR